MYFWTLVRTPSLNKELDDKNERLKAVELYNARMITKNNDLEKGNKKLKAAERKMQEDAKKDYLMRKLSGVLTRTR